MSCLGRMVALLLVAFWLPASSHVHLQHLGLIHQVHADHHPHHHHHDHGDAPPGHHEHGADNHAAADGECLHSPRSSGLDLSWGGLSGFGFQWVPVFSGDAPVVIHEATGLAPPGTGPPRFPVSWQFLLRAALPVRAPSFVS